MTRTIFSCLLASAILLAQQPLTNEDVLKLAKAGMNDDVLISMMQQNPGNYSTTPDSVIAVKTAGISDKVIAAIVTTSTSPAAGTAKAEALLLQDATPVKLRLTRNLSSADCKAGNSVGCLNISETGMGIEAPDLMKAPRFNDYRLKAGRFLYD